MSENKPFFDALQTAIDKLVARDRDCDFVTVNGLSIMPPPRKFIEP
jgi:hypothetical protein